jgi:hypothetical protein
MVQAGALRLKGNFCDTGLISGVIVRIDTEDLTITPVAKIG